jgi:hypothetical protein
LLFFFFLHLLSSQSSDEQQDEQPEEHPQHPGPPQHAAAMAKQIPKMMATKSKSKNRKAIGPMP